MVVRHELLADPASTEDAVAAATTAQKNLMFFGWWYDVSSSSSGAATTAPRTTIEDPINSSSKRSKYYSYHHPKGGLCFPSSQRWAFLRFLALFSMLLLFVLLFALQRSLIRTTQQQSLDKSHLSATNVSTDPAVARAVCNDTVQRLVDANIRLVALDFDLTVIDVHTGGYWKRTAADLAPHVRPDFVALIELCLHRGLYVSVATFSTQKTLIADVLGQALGAERAATIPIWGGGDLVKHYAQGKQSQLHLAIEYFNRRRRTHTNAVASTIQPSNAVLVDDDLHNIAIAHRDGYRTMPYIPGKSICLTEVS